MTTDVLFAGLPVTDFARARDFYERLFGRPADVVAHAHEVMWRVTDTGWLYIVADADRAGHGLVTIAVPDLDRFVADLAARGIACGPTEPVGDAGRKAIATDPDRNAVAFIQVAA